MKLAERYAYDVARRLPEKQRDDVRRELIAEIESMAEDRSPEGKVTKGSVRDVLIEMGSPRVLADKYRERPRFLIGPDYFELYISLLKTLFMVILPLSAFIVWMTEVFSATHTPLSMFIKVAGTLMEVAVHILLWTTLSFAVAERVANGQPHDHHWKPEDLPELPPKRRIPRSESFFALAWSVFAILATLYQVPVIYNAIGPESVPQFFAPEMWPYWTSGLLAVAILGLGAEIVKLIVGGWTKLTVGVIAFANVITVGFFAALIINVQPIANSDMVRLVASSLHWARAEESIDAGIRIFVCVLIAICIGEVVSALYKYRKGGTQ